jgi:aminopeptidase N
MIKIPSQILTVLSVMFATMHLTAQHDYKCKNSYKSLDKFNPNFLYDSRSDSIDIIKQSIVLNITDFTNKTISGNCNTFIKAKVDNINNITLDLRGFTIDSVILSTGVPLSNAHIGEKLIINFNQPLMMNDSVEVKVYYGGATTPGSSFGGFYWQSGIAYNLGVGLDDIPHNMGRAWFPCFDNFVERALYDLHITVDTANKAVCGGVLDSVSWSGGNTHTFHWTMHQTVPTYLVSVAVGKYQFVNDLYTSQFYQNKPIQLAALASDTTNMKLSFVNLKQTIGHFENLFGPYLWDRVGYVLVPFNSGAMEHAMNITYPRSFALGNLTFETVMAHELSHHWFGDLITCETAEDMWINEGGAVFCEYIFLENVYNKAAALSALRKNHKRVLESAHVDDNGYWPISGVPQAETYGSTTYLKGANVIHSLRSYMGDAAFFDAIKNVMNEYQFKHINSFNLNEALNQYSGQNLDQFFTDWVYQPGFTSVNIDSFAVKPIGNQFEVKVYTRQKLKAANTFFKNLPIQITFKSSDWNEHNQTLVHSNELSVNTFTVPFQPEIIILNNNEGLAYAVTGNNYIIKNTGAQNNDYARVNLNTINVNDSAFVHAEMHWVSPDPIQPFMENTAISPGRFWKIDVIKKDGTQIDATFYYDGSNTNLGFENPIINQEDSVILLYRKNAGFPWIKWSDFTITKGLPTDKRGNITAKNVISGEFAIGSADFQVGIESLNSKNHQFLVFPNPANDCIRIKLKNNLFTNIRLDVLDINGKTVFSREFQNSSEMQIHTNNFGSGTYSIILYSGEEIIDSQKIVIAH